jgi:ribonuclease HII
MVSNAGGFMTGTLFGEAPRDLLVFEKLAKRRGFTAIAGVDEAGRGALAGPVVAAAVILSPEGDYAGIDDSKKLTPEVRDTLFDRIMQQALAVGIGFADQLLVDHINVLQATLHAMAQAVRDLSTSPDFLLIDGISVPPTQIPCRTIKKGDSASVSIASASIVAKVTRDRMMRRFDDEYPGYGFAIHKGYGSRAHMSAISLLGPCAIHRTTFRGVREFVGRRE